MTGAERGAGHSAQVRVALVGYGFVGKTFHAPLIAETEGMSLHTIVSTQSDAVRADWPAVRFAATLADTLLDPAIDLVVIATPNDMHATQAHAALEAGKHVVVDKPFTVTVAEAEAVAAHAARAGRVLSVFQNRRYDSDFLTLQGVVASGALGEITQFESHFDRFRPHVRDRWREQAIPGAGLWYDLGPHLLDQAVHLFGTPIGITADIGLQRDGALSDDYFHVLLRYDRLRVILHASTLMLANDLRFSVHGTRGSFVKHGLDSQEDALKAGRTPGDAGWGDDLRPAALTRLSGESGAPDAVVSIPGDYRRYYSAVRDAVRGNPAANPVPPGDAVRVMRLLSAAQQSAARRREVTTL
jgi:predicted dehydrogenase